MRCANTTASQAPKHLPPKDPDDFAPCWRSERTLQTTISTWVWPPRPDVRHAFTHSLCMLGTPRCDCSSKLGEPRAVYGILQLITIFEHTREHSKPPHPAASCHLSSDSAPCEAPSAELTQPRGCVAPTLHNHHPRDRSRRGFTPT